MVANVFVPYLVGVHFEYASLASRFEAFAVELLAIEVLLAAINVEVVCDSMR